MTRSKTIWRTVIKRYAMPQPKPVDRSLIWAPDRLSQVVRADVDPTLCAAVSDFETVGEPPDADSTLFAWGCDQGDHIERGMNSTLAVDEFMRCGELMLEDRSTEAYTIKRFSRRHRDKSNFRTNRATIAEALDHALEGLLNATG